MSSSTYAQLTDTSKINQTATDSVLIIKKIEKKHSPKKAALFSTALPGLGQAYNKKYWKIPIIYAGFAGLGYAFSVNQTKFVNYRNAYKYRIDGDITTTDEYIGVYSDDNLNTLQKY